MPLCRRRRTSSQSTGPVQPKSPSFRVLVCAARTLHGAGQPWATPLLRQERLRAACGPSQEERSLPVAQKLSVLGSWGKAMRDAVGNKERWERRRTPTQDPSTNHSSQANALPLSVGVLDVPWHNVNYNASDLGPDKHGARARTPHARPRPRPRTPRGTLPKQPKETGLLAR